MILKNYITIGLLMVCFNSCISQKPIQTSLCRGNIMDVKPFVKGFDPCSQCEINVKSLNKGFSIELSDSTYKIVGFQIYYFNDQGLSFKNDIKGNKVNNRNVDFLGKLKVGDNIAIECINIEKNNEPALSTTMLILVSQ